MVSTDPVKDAFENDVRQRRKASEKSRVTAEDVGGCIGTGFIILVSLMAIAAFIMSILALQQ